MELTDVPFILNFYRFGTTWKLTVRFSQFWTFIDYGFYSAQAILFAWATVERHILIFNDGWVSTKKKRFFLHYLPVIIILTYCFIYYLTVVVFLSCPYMNSQSPINGVPAPCLYDQGFSVTWDLVCHQIIPTFVIEISSIALLVRVLYQNGRVRQRIQWRKQRKMAIQLLSITLLYQLLNFPWSFIEFCQLVNLPVDVEHKAFTVAYFLPYYLISCFPFVCCGTLPELQKKLNKLLFWQRQRRIVGPTMIPMNPIQSNRTFQKSTDIH
jgi:hypothetical protein